MDIVWYPGWFPYFGIAGLALIVCVILLHKTNIAQTRPIKIVHIRLPLVVVKKSLNEYSLVCNYIHGESRMITTPAHIP